MQPPPHNSAQAAPRPPVHIHIVDDYNLDSSLDVASVLLTSRALASCEQIRVSTSGLNPSLYSHPKLNSVKNAAKKFNYGTTSFEDSDLLSALEWSAGAQRRNSLVAGSSGPRHFAHVESQCRESVRSFVSNPQQQEGGGTSGSNVPECPMFDLVLCCSRDVYEGTCQYLEHIAGGTAAAPMPQTLFVLFFDPRFTSSSSSSVTSSSADSNNSNNKPSLGQLFTSFTVEVLGLQHVRGQLPQHQPEDAAQNVSTRWKERFASSLKQFEQLRRVEVLYRPFVL